MKQITKHQVNQAISDWKQAKDEQARAEARMQQAQIIISDYCQGHLEDFTENQLQMEAGVIALQSGPAKPLKEGKPLATAARVELATALPEAYVKVNCDFSLLYQTKNPKVREILKSRGITIVREDRYVVR